MSSGELKSAADAFRLGFSAYLHNLVFRGQRHRRHRLVKSWLCPGHRGQPSMRRQVAGSLIAAGLPMTVAGIFVQRLPSWFTIVLIFGMGAFVFGFVLSADPPNLVLVSESPSGMWVKGAARPFAERYPPLSHHPAKTS